MDICDTAMGTARHSKIEILLQLQSKPLKTIIVLPDSFQIRPNKNLKTITVKEGITCYRQIYQRQLEKHPNYLAVNLLVNSEFINRLKINVKEFELQEMVS